MSGVNTNFVFLKLVEYEVVHDEPLLSPPAGSGGVAQQIGTDLHVLVSRFHLPQDRG